MINLLQRVCEFGFLDMLRIDVRVAGGVRQGGAAGWILNLLDERAKPIERVITLISKRQTIRRVFLARLVARRIVRIDDAHAQSVWDKLKQQAQKTQQQKQQQPKIPCELLTPSRQRVVKDSTKEQT